MSRFITRLQDAMFVGLAVVVLFLIPTIIEIVVSVFWRKKS